MQKPKKYKLKSLNVKKYTPKRKNTDFGSMYNEDWKKYRFRFLHYNKKCYICGSPSNVVDHIQAHKGNAELFESLYNHMPLCKKCHDMVTGRFDRFDPPKTEEKLEWIKKKRKFMRISHKITPLAEYIKKKK